MASAFFNPVVQLVEQEPQVLFGALVVSDVDLDAVPDDAAVLKPARGHDDAVPAGLAGLGMKHLEFGFELLQLPMSLQLPARIRARCSGRMRL